MKKLRSIEWSLVPAFVLLVALTLTGIAGGLRARVISANREAAVVSAAGHFRSLVTDYENRANAVSQAYERVLTGAMLDLDGETSPDQISARLSELTADKLPGLQSFYWLTADAAPVRLIGTAATIDPETLAAPRVAGRWESFTDYEADVVAVSQADATGTTLIAVASISNLLGQQAAISEDTHAEHGVTARLVADHPEHTPYTVGIESASPGSAEEVPPDGLHPHGQVNNVHRGPIEFIAAPDVSMFGQPWVIEVTAGSSFLDVPSSREVEVILALGLASSLLLFGLIQHLVRRLRAETSHRDAEARARSANERFAASFASSPIGVALCDRNGQISEVNNAMAVLLEQSPDDLAGTPIAELVIGADDAYLDADNGPSPAPGEQHRRGEVRYRTRSGRHVWVDETRTTVVGPDGLELTLVQLSDITEQRDARDELVRRALHDDLTGLPNRPLLEDRIDQAIRRLRRQPDTSAAVMFIDVDNFKVVNDTMGHNAGDELLVELADRLRASAREQDTISRWGGDEFVLICEGLTSPHDVWRVADRLRSQTEDPFEVGGRVVNVTLSIGIAICGPDDVVETLLRDADLAMYQAKDSGRNKAAIFEIEMRDELMKNLELETDLIRAIEEEELELYYQPILELETRQVLGFEALIRWNHPTRGLVSPVGFLPAASELGLMRRIDLWVIDAVARQAAEWAETVPLARSWTISANCSPCDFTDPGFSAEILSALHRAGADPLRITIEITEEAIFGNSEAAVANIAALRAAGITIAIDDFGTGYSSLSQLAELDIDILKIDRSFVTAIHKSDSKEIVRAILQMAQALDVAVVAEGVEDNDELATLLEIGATRAQGYLFSRPVPPDEALSFALSAAEVSADIGEPSDDRHLAEL